MKDIQPQTFKGSAGQFVGDVYSVIMLAGREPSRVRVATVHFAPGARTAWHSHAMGQYLYVMEGTALVQERRDEVQVLEPGDTIYTAPGVEHWHGAAPNSYMVHLAIWEAPAPGMTETKWGAQVTEKEYRG